MDGMKEMLDKNISFSLYMAHGGTSFDHWAGANFPNFSPTCTSYDYDAPITESGRATPKYFKVRNLLKKYLPDGESLPAVPDSIPTISIPAIHFTKIAPLFDNLPNSKFSKDVKSMELFGQGWGSILYRTTIAASNIPQTLILTDANDWTQVYIDGKRIGVLNRLKGENSLVIPPVEKSAVLDILVEAMGRMNFGKGIYDWKGITKKVELRSTNGVANLKNWNVYNIPTDYSFAKKKSYISTNIQKNKPGFYKSQFYLSKTGDTFLDMTNWSKGFVYINGHNLGRYWNIGPQQTLYLPGCWLKRGANEIIVFDLASPREATIRGIRTPILDKLDTSTTDYINRKNGENLDLTKDSAIYHGTFTKGHDWQQIKFQQSFTARYFCLEALNAYDGKQFASIAELELQGNDGANLPRQHWRIFYADSEETNAANNTASNVFDLQESTIWHTNYSINPTPFPHQIVIDLGEDVSVSGFKYLPRSEENKTGMIKDFRVYFSKTPFKK